MDWKAKIKADIADEKPGILSFFAKRKTADVSNVEKKSQPSLSITDTAAPSSPSEKEHNSARPQMQREKPSPGGSSRKSNVAPAFSTLEEEEEHLIALSSSVSCPICFEEVSPLVLAKHVEACCAKSERKHAPRRSSKRAAEIVDHGRRKSRKTAAAAAPVAAPAAATATGVAPQDGTGSAKADAEDDEGFGFGAVGGALAASSDARGNGVDTKVAGADANPDADDEALAEAGSNISSSLESSGIASGAVGADNAGASAAALGVDSDDSDDDSDDDRVAAAAAAAAASRKQRAPLFDPTMFAESANDLRMSDSDDDSGDDDLIAVSFGKR